MRETYENKLESWSTPAEIDGSSPTLFGSSPMIDAINQGQLGDCWFLSAVAAIAEKPERIEKIISNYAWSDHGEFEFNFFFRGKPFIV
jgi:hypothetical protein